MSSKTVVALLKSATPTYHPEDIPKRGHPVRIYPPEELKKVVEKCKNKEIPVRITHTGQLVEGAKVSKLGWLDTINSILCELELPDELAEKVPSEYPYVSWDVLSANYEKTPDGIIYRDLDLREVALLPADVKPGDMYAGVTLLESEGKLLMTVELQERIEKVDGRFCVVHCHGPEAGKPIKCFDTYEEALAFHRAIMANRESSESEKKISELQDALNRSAALIEQLKREMDGKVAEAEKKAKLEVLSEVEKVIPNGYLVDKLPVCGKRAFTDLRRIIYKHRSGQL